MLKNGGIIAVLCAVALSVPNPVVAADAFTEALIGGKASGDIRLRYEDVSDDATADDGEALTVRTRLGYETAPFMGFTAMAEFEDVRSVFGVDGYQVPGGSNPPNATILDRDVTEVNRAFIRYRGVSRLDLGYGRQRIIYDNARFIGNVGWRQDEQTFDGFTAAYTGLTDFAINYAYLTRVNGVDETLDSDDIDDHLLNIVYSGLGIGKLSGYAYLLDHQDETDIAVNAGLRFHTSDTYGARFDGAYALPIAMPVRLLYTLEYATQEFETSAGIERRADYLFGETGVVYTRPAVMFTAKVAYEELGTDDGLYGFQTPYATKHAFNGWADKFLVTPASGLQDTFVTLGVNLIPPKVNVLVAYHVYEYDYKSERGDFDYGDEWNMQVIKVLSPNYTIGLKYAAYSGEDGPYLDTDKLWVWGEFKF